MPAPRSVTIVQQFETRPTERDLIEAVNATVDALAPPVVTISSPRTGTTTRKRAIVVKGTASNNVAVASLTERR